MRYGLTLVLYTILTTIIVDAQPVREIDSDELLVLTSTLDETTYVVNFWATWCSPCVKEIVHFEELHRKSGSDRLKVFLVSLDFPNQVDRRVIPFLEEKNISAPVLVMTDLDYNSWIDSVDANWSGAIPATLILNRYKRVFLEKELSRDELFEQVSQFTN